MLCHLRAVCVCTHCGRVAGAPSTSISRSERGMAQHISALPSALSASDSALRWYSAVVDAAVQQLHLHLPQPPLRHS